MIKISSLVMICGLMLACNNKPPATESQNTIPSETATSVYIEDSLIENVTLTKIQIDSITKELDIMLENGDLYLYSYPNKTAWGGLNGYYLDKELVITSSKQSGEFGFTASRYYWKDEKLIKVLITNGIYEWNKENTKMIREDKEDYINPSHIIILTEKNHVLKRDKSGTYVIMTDTSWVDKEIRDGIKSRKFYEQVVAEE